MNHTIVSSKMQRKVYMGDRKGGNVGGTSAWERQKSCGHVKGGISCMCRDCGDASGIGVYHVEAAGDIRKNGAFYFGNIRNFMFCRRNILRPTGGKEKISLRHVVRNHVFYTVILPFCYGRPRRPVRDFEKRSSLLPVCVRRNAGRHGGRVRLSGRKKRDHGGRVKLSGRRTGLLPLGGSAKKVFCPFIFEYYVI